MYKTTVYRQNINIVKIYASELRKFGHFYIVLKVLFLSIFCWYFRYFVGTNDMLVGLHVPTNFQMYRQHSEKALWGGGGDNCPPPPPPPSGYASEFRMVKLLLSTIWAANASLFNEQIFGREWGGGGCVDGGWRPGGRREGEERVRDVVLFCLDFFFLYLSFYFFRYNFVSQAERKYTVYYIYLWLYCMIKGYFLYVVNILT